MVYRLSANSESTIKEDTKIETKCIYIADDDDNIREAIRIFLENDGYQVTAFISGEDLLAAFNHKPCDLAVLDIMMNGIDGFTVCQSIRKVSTVPIIMLTALDSDFDYAKGISLGSDDYFTKPFSPMALVMRVKAIFRRIEYEKQAQATNTPSQSLSFGNITINAHKKTVILTDSEINLTPNEYDLLKYMIEHADRAVSREELLDTIWGCGTEIETRATDDTVRRLRKKIEKSNVVIDAVWGFGFRLKCAAPQ